MKRSIRMSTLVTAVAGAILAGACTVGSGGEAGEPRPASVGPVAVGDEFGVTHHALIRGVVMGRDGRPLAGVEVVTDRIVTPPGASMPRNRGVSGEDGTFTVPAQATLEGDSATVQVMVVAFGFPYAHGDRVPADSVVVAVTLVGTARAPHAYPARLTLSDAP